MATKRSLRSTASRSLAGNPKVDSSRLAPAPVFRCLENVGHSQAVDAFVVSATTAEHIAAVFRLAADNSWTIAARGAGQSYNSAPLNGGGIVLDLAKMNRIISWDPHSGLITAEPGVTLEQVWKTVEPDGWWPPVVSGTMFTTLGGCLSANIHGKNNYRVGTIGEHVVEFTALLPSGKQVVCTPKKNTELFYSMIGGLGLLGVFTRITMKMKQVHSGLIEVSAMPVGSLHEHLAVIKDGAPAADYIVGWMDALAGGSALGRGQIHAARNLQAGEDPAATDTLKLSHQHLPDRLFGVMPKAWLHYFMSPFMNNMGVRLVNFGKNLTSQRRHVFRQSHAEFHFLLDYVPEWELAYGRGGLIQYQSFLPLATAEDAYREMIQLSHRRGLPSYLGVTKRHRPDLFLLSYAVDGFSLALDFKVTDRKRAQLSAMLQEFDRITLQAGGRLYFAKNSETTAATARAFLGARAIARLHELKRKCDPHGLLVSDLYRRVFAR